MDNIQIDYKALLANLYEKPSRDKNDEILIIDGLNTLIRCFSVVAAVNPKGNNVGGLTGFLKSLGALKRQFNPTRIIVAWDGKGGATNRKHINANYKAQRASSPVIHWDVYDSKEEEVQSLHAQAERLEDYLGCLPVTYVKVDKLEADDIIAYIAQSAAAFNRHVTIVSSDKDFLQLVSENIDVYSPTKKKLYDYAATFEFLMVLPENYNIVKALVGDDSDNITGIKGAGFKTLVKLFPRLATDPEYTLQDIYDECAAKLGTKKLYAVILNEWDRVEQNFSIMDLHETVLDEAEKGIVSEKIKEPVAKTHAAKFMMLLEQDCIEGITNNTETWLQDFSNL